MSSFVPGTRIDFGQVPLWIESVQKIDWQGVWEVVQKQDFRTSSFAPFGLTSDPFPLTNRWIPIIGVALYLFVVIKLSPKDNRGPKTGGVLLKLFSILHNIIMMTFSFMAFYYTLPAFTDGFNKGLSVYDIVCNGGTENWDVLGFWSWLFYLSKYYEFADTFTVMLKNRRPILLQYYHHAGAVITMWMLVQARHPGVMVFVTFNAFIHTIMYGYYLLTSLHISALRGLLTTIKPLITSLQLVQFAVGIYCTTGVNSMLKCASDPNLRIAQEAAISLSHLYVIILVGLFFDFAVKNYMHPKHRHHHSSRSRSKRD